MDSTKSLSTRSEKLVEFLKRIPLFSCMSEENIYNALHILKEKFCRKNNVVLFEEDTSRFMYIIYSGKVKVVQYGADEREQMLAVHKKGEFFGEMSILDGRTYPARVIAMEDSRIFLISGDDFKSVIMSSEDGINTIISVLCKRLRESWMMLRVLKLPNAEQRIRAVLNQLGKLYGVKDSRGTILTLKLSHKEISEYTNVSRETVTRVMGALTTKGEIAMLENRHILVKSRGIELQED